MSNNGIPPRALWERLLRQLDQHERWVSHARAARRDRKQEVAALGEEPRRPSSPALAAIFATGAIALSFTLPLHDIVFARLLPLPERALFASFAAACLISATATSTALAGTRLVLRQKAPRLGPGALAAVLLATALLLLRLAGTTEVAQWMLAAGFSVLELACVLLLETYAHRLAHRRSEYRQDREIWLAAEAQVVVAEDEVELAERELVVCRRAVEELLPLAPGFRVPEGEPGCQPAAEHAGPPTNGAGRPILWPAHESGAGSDLRPLPSDQG